MTEKVYVNQRIKLSVIDNDGTKMGRSVRISPLHRFFVDPKFYDSEGAFRFLNLFAFYDREDTVAGESPKKTQSFTPVGKGLILIDYRIKRIWSYQAFVKFDQVTVEYLKQSNMRFETQKDKKRRQGLLEKVEYLFSGTSGSKREPLPDGSLEKFLDQKYIPPALCWAKLNIAPWTIVDFQENSREAYDVLSTYYSFSHEEDEEWKTEVDLYEAMC